MPHRTVGSLAGRRVLVTRPVDQAAPLVEALTATGAEPVVYPTTRIADPPSWEPFDRAFAADNVVLYTLAIFTSATAVRRTLDRLRASGGGLRFPTNARLAAVGRQTAAALETHGYLPDEVPTDERQEGLAQALDEWPPGGRAVFPQALDGRPFLRDDLQRRGFHIDVVPVYQTLAVTDGPPPPPFDAATFLSPSALEAFVARGAETRALLERAVVAVIGPTTHDAARKLGVRVDVVSPAASVKALVDALVAFYAGERP